MRIYLDTDVHGKLAVDAAAASIERWLDASEFYVSDTVAEELFGAPRDRSAPLFAWLERRLHHATLLAPMNHQIEWSIRDYRAGRRSPRLFPAYGIDSIRRFLIEPSSVPETLREALLRKAQDSSTQWEAMHASGRQHLQNVLASGKIPSEQEWIEWILPSQFAADLVNAYAPPQLRRWLSRRVSAFLAWHPLLRAFFQLYLLAIRRHGILPATASSRKGPKWPDYYHAAFVAVADVFATDDRRLRAVIAEYLQVRTDLVCKVVDLAGLRALAGSQNP